MNTNTRAGYDQVSSFVQQLMGLATSKVLTKSGAPRPSRSVKSTFRSVVSKIPCLCAGVVFLCTSPGVSASYSNLKLIQEIDAGAATGSNYESGGTVSTQVILGATARVAASKASWFGYKLGSALDFNRPYVIEIEYPEDVPRAYLMLLMDCGGWGAGSHYAFHTGVYETKDSRFYWPENLTAYPLRQVYKSYRIIAWPQRHWSVEPRMKGFKSTHGDFDTGLWLYFVNKEDDPNNHGLAVKTIKLYSVGGVEDLLDPQVEQLRVQAPRRTFWTLESDSRNNGEAHVAKARIAGANTVVWQLMAWNWNNGQYAYGADYVDATLRTILPAAKKHRMDVILKLEYGGSPSLPETGWAISPNNKGHDVDLTRIAGHGSGKTKCLNVREPAVLQEVKDLIDLVYKEAGLNAKLIKGIMLRNRYGFLAPGFADADIDAYESETGNKIAGATSSEKRATLKTELAWPNGNQQKTYDVGKNHQHPYMQWYYQKLGDFLGNIEKHLKSTYGSDKVLLYIPFSGEGMNRNMPTDQSRFLATREWGYEPGVYRNRTFHYLLPADQHWNAGSSAYLNAMNTAAGTSIYIDPIYIEHARAWFPYSGLAPSFEHGGQEWAQRSEILVVANSNPTLLGKSDFSAINRGFPDQWNEFLKHFYLIPNETGTILLDNPTITVKTYSAGRVLVINKSLTSTTVNLGANYPTLYNKITGASVSTNNIPVGASSMVMFGTQSGGLPSAAPAPLPELEAIREIYQAEDAYKSAGSIESAWPNKGDMYYKYPGESGAFLEFTVEVPTAGNYHLEFRYLLQNAGNLLELKVNGQVIAARSEFPATDNPRRFKSMTFSNVAMFAGANKIRLTALGNDGPGIDQLEVIYPNRPKR
jgi:hypothetical protein